MVRNVLVTLAVAYFVTGAGAIADCVSGAPLFAGNVTLYLALWYLSLLTICPSGRTCLFTFPTTLLSDPPSLGRRTFPPSPRVWPATEGSQRARKGFVTVHLCLCAFGAPLCVCVCLYVYLCVQVCAHTCLCVCICVWSGGKSRPGFSQ